jgi:hypothetical protein
VNAGDAEKKAAKSRSDASATPPNSDQNVPSATLENVGQTMLDDSLARALDAATKAGNWTAVVELAKTIGGRGGP